MSIPDCPDSEILARFATRTSPHEEWRQVVRHLADCDLCRRQAALVAETVPVDLPLDSREVPALRARPVRTRPEWAVAAAAALLLGGMAWVLLRIPREATVPADLPRPGARIRSITAPAPAPKEESSSTSKPAESKVEIPLEAPTPPPLPRPSISAVSPSPPPLPPPSPFLVERTSSEVSQAIEVVAERGDLTRVSSRGSEPLKGKAMVQPSDTLTSPAGVAVLLPDGSTLHLAPESQVRVAWSQTLTCTTLDVRSGDAVVDLGKTPKPVFVSHQTTGIRLRNSVGRVYVSADEGSLRATLLSGVAEVRTRTGTLRTLSPHESLVLRESSDSLESVEKTDVSHFSTLEPAAHVPLGGITPRPGPEVKLPSLDVLVTSLAGQSYAYRVSGREVREGVWSPAGIYTSAIENITTVRRADDDDNFHFQRGPRPWDEVGKPAPTSRETHLVEILRGLKAPHLMVKEWAAQISEAGAPRTDKVRDRLCLVWNQTYSPDLIRKSMESAIDAAVAEGRLDRPELVYWETLEGVLEVAALKYELRLMRVVDRRKVVYSCKTVAGFDRRTYVLETTIEFLSHGVAVFPLSSDLIKRLNLAK